MDLATMCGTVRRTAPRTKRPTRRSPFHRNRRTTVAGSIEAADLPRPETYRVAVKLTKRRSDPASETSEAAGPADAAVSAGDRPGGKGRPTPKRRDVVGQRGPVTAPKTRKEAYARQKAQAKAAKAAARKPQSQLTVAERRALLKAGDPSVLPRRDQGQTRKLARDYVDSHRMASNYLLILFPLILVGYVLPILQLAVLVLFLVLIVEWMFVGRRIRQLAIERFGKAEGGAASIGFYAGSRAYLPRRFRLPAPQKQLGDPI
jgi:hypothetical protein